METGANNWRLTAQREEDGVTLLRAVTCDTRAALPDTLWGLPVTALGDHALSPSAQMTTEEGTAAQITGGPEGPIWDNAALRELTFPASLRRVGDYALLNCRALKTLCVHDGVTFWGSGALMNCRELDTIRIIQESGDGGAMAYFAGELNRELDITVTGPDGPFLRLIFPEYREVYEENCPAHHFDYVIEGAGYPYHHCFRQRRLNLLEYDHCWERAKDSMAERTALRLAWWRLRYPAGLTDRTGYLNWLRVRSGAAAAWLTEERDISALALLLQWTEPDREALAYAASVARERRDSAALALLLEEQHRRFSPSTDHSRFAL